MLSLWVDYLLTSFTAMWGSEGGLIAFQRGRKLKHTSSALIQCDYDLNHRRLGRQEARWRRLTVRWVISLVSEKLLTHIITPSPLEKKKKKKKDPRSVHTLQQSQQCSGRGEEDRLREDRWRGIIKKSQSMELWDGLLKMLSLIVLTTIFSLPGPNGLVMSTVI